MAEGMTMMDVALVYALHAGTAAAMTLVIMLVVRMCRLLGRLAEVAPRWWRIMTGRRRVLAANGEIIPGGGCVMETMSGRWVRCDEEGRRWR